MILAMAQNPQAAAGKGAPNPLLQFLPFILMIFVIWFFMMRPQSKKQKELQQMLDGLQVNDMVLTSGGIIGKVVSIKPDKNIVVIEIDDTNHIRVDFQRSAIVSLLNKDIKQG